MEEYCFNLCQILTLFIYTLFGLFVGEISAEGKPGSIPFFNRHYDCIPKLTHSGVPVESTLHSNGYHLENVTLQFVAFGSLLKVDLSLNRQLFPSAYVERLFYFNESGIDHNSTERKVPENCFYHGIVQGQPRSEAALSTCHGGISGYITDRRDTYHIQQLKGRMHRVYRNSDQRKLPFKCGTVGHDNSLHSHQQVLKRYKRSTRAPYDANKNTRYVELYLVNDYRTYERHGKDMDIVIKRSQDVANIVSSLYRQLNIYVALVGVEVWGAGDLIIISTSADNTMENFLRYRKERINPIHHNDNAQLITGKFFDHGVVGKAIKGPICTHQYSGGVDMDYGGLVTLVATTVAHEMGHNFGMEHDNDTMCECRDEKCIMAATSGQISPRHWSSCSQNALAEAFDLGMDYCLRNLPEMIYHGPVCGNGFKEEGEECDCGLPQDCTNRCCNPNTCQMYNLAQCATGMCCDLTHCKPKTASTMCREPTGECDLPEYCNGFNEYCPDDYFVQDGHSCRQGESYCYKGQCNTHTNQCKLLWGETGRVSDPICFQQLNMNGNGDGSCAYNWTTNRYTRCDKEDVLCGLLHCVHLNEKLMFWKDNLALVMGASFLSRGNKLYVCRSAMLDVGLDMKDPGLVPDGAKCEQNKICINQKCVSLAKLDMIPCDDDCNGRGRCNSNNTCHCDIGYAPPLCDRPGFGGSLSSGPATNEYDTSVVSSSTESGSRITTPNLSTTNITTDTDTGTGLGVKKDLLVGLLVVLIFLIFVVLGILAYCNRRRLQICLKRMPDIKYRVKGKSEKSRPPSLLDSTTTLSRNDSDHCAGNPPVCIPKTSIWDPLKTSIKVPPKRPTIAPKRISSGSKFGSELEKEQFSNTNVSFCSSQPNVGITSNPVSSDNIPSSPKSASKAIVKRESIRGSKISEPVLMSTTNRNSVVLADMQVSLIGPEADKDPRANSPSQRLKANHSIKRSLSDRQCVRPDFANKLQTTNFGSGTLRKTDSAKQKFDPPTAATSSPDFRPRPLPPEPTEPEDEKELIYANEMDMGDLLQDIELRLKTDNLYCNLTNGEEPEEDKPPELPARKALPNVANGLDNSWKTKKPTPKSSVTQNNESSFSSKVNDTNKSAVSSAKNIHPHNTKSPSSNNNKKPFTTKSSTSSRPVEELKNKLQNKSKFESPVIQKKATTNPPLGAKAISHKPTTISASSVSNPPNTSISRMVNHSKNKNDSPLTKQRSEEIKSLKASLKKTNSLDSNNKKSNVSNLAARFGQGAEETEIKSSSPAIKPLLKRTPTVTGTVPNRTDKPEIIPKPMLPPKPGGSGDKSPSIRPASSIKRVQSYRI